MRIVYENTMEDIIAFTEYHYANSAAYKKQIRLTTTYLPVIFTFLVFGYYSLIGKIPILVIGLTVVWFYTLFIRRSVRTQLAKFVRRQFEEIDTSGLFCEHTLEFDEEVISETTSVSERRDKWDGVQNIVNSDDNAFIYVGPMQGHVIPRERVAEGDFDGFVKALSDTWDKVRNP